MVRLNAAFRQQDRRRRIELLFDAQVIAGRFQGDGHVTVAAVTPEPAMSTVAVTQSPVTSAIIVMEMIDSHGMVISLMTAALVAKAVSSRMGPELFQQLARGFLENAEPATTPKNPTR